MSTNRLHITALDCTLVAGKTTHTLVHSLTGPQAYRVDLMVSTTGHLIAACDCPSASHGGRPGCKHTKIITTIIANELGLPVTGTQRLTIPALAGPDPTDTMTEEELFDA